MRFFRSSILSVGLLLAFSSVAAADSNWQTVSLDNNPDFTIDVPAVVGNDYLPDEKGSKQGTLMFFAVNTQSSADMFCMLNRVEYDNQMGPKEAAAKLATSTRDVLCTAGDDVSNVSVVESHSLTSNGYPAGACAASLSDSDDKTPGAVITMLAIAAPHAMYELQCQVRAASQEDAKADWDQQWSAEISHIQQSLHLPATPR